MAPSATFRRCDSSGFRCLPPHVAVSHAYMHMVDFGSPVEICGLTNPPGDLLYGGLPRRTLHPEGNRHRVAGSRGADSDARAPYLRFLPVSRIFSRGLRSELHSAYLGLFSCISVLSLQSPYLAWQPALVAACGRQEKAVEANVSAGQRPSVAVAKAAPQDMSRDVVLTGEFKPFQEIDVMAKVAGYIKKINVDIGDRVKQGQLLATLEIPEMADDLARSKANLRRSMAEVRRSQEEIQRARVGRTRWRISSYTRLASVMKDRPGLVAQQEVDDAHSRDLVAEAQVAAAKSSRVSRCRNR